MKRCKILRADSVSELQETINDHLTKGWQMQGGPFLSTWAEGSGPTHAMPHRPETIDPSWGWINVTYCQALLSP